MITRSAPARMYRALFLAMCAPFALMWVVRPAFATQTQEWMTPKEIEKFRDEQGLAKRTGMYMSAAKLRLDKAAERLSGKSSAEGDPLEFNSVTDLVLGCRSAIRAAMIAIQDQVSYRKAENEEVIKALKELKGTAEDIRPALEKIQKQAIEKRDEPLYKAVKECADYADSAARGAKTAIEKLKK